MSFKCTTLVDSFTGWRALPKIVLLRNEKMNHSGTSIDRMPFFLGEVQLFQQALRGGCFHVLATILSQLRTFE